MKIVKTVIEPSEAGYQLAVAIESAPGYWKAYYLTFEHYPTQADAERVANVGRKIYKQRKAELVFGNVPKLIFE